jgi:hypothetical protein
MINNEITSWTQPVGSEINMETVNESIIPGLWC